MNLRPLLSSRFLCLVFVFGTYSPLDAQESDPVISNLLADRVTEHTARINGDVNPSGLNRVVQFQWGVEGDTFPNIIPLNPNFVNLNSPTTFRANLADLEPGVTYHFRIRAGNVESTPLTFRTLVPPTAIINEATAVTTTRALAKGSVDPKGDIASVSFEYVEKENGFAAGTGIIRSVSATPSVISSDSPVEVTATLTGLVQGTTYLVRIRAEGSKVVRSEPIEFSLSVLSDLTQVEPITQPPSNANFKVLFAPHSNNGVMEPVGGWRFVGNKEWRYHGDLRESLVSGQREIEFLPVNGFVHPINSTVNLVPRDNVLEANDDRNRYIESQVGVRGSLHIQLKPDNLTTGSPPAAQWAIVADPLVWRNSGETLPLTTGTYEVQFKSISGRPTPSSIDVSITDGEQKSLVIVYPPPIISVGLAPVFQEVNNPVPSIDNFQTYVGLIRGEGGESSTGFVVKKRVVATAGHVVFDDGNLSNVTNLLWFFQRHRQAADQNPPDPPGFEPIPIAPRGYFLATGYDAQRRMDKSPGQGTAASQKLDFAALFFTKDAGRGGHAGYLASDREEGNEFLLDETAEKRFAGYAVRRLEVAKVKVHVTPAFVDAMEMASRETYSTSIAHGLRGMSGGPLFVRYQKEGIDAFYPAAIYLGGSEQAVVRAIDSHVVDLFLLAELSGNGGDNNSSAGFSSQLLDDSREDGDLKVIIEPAAARNLNAKWILGKGTPFRVSGATDSLRRPAKYIVNFSEIPGFRKPEPDQPVEVKAGTQTLTYTYRTHLEFWRFVNFNTYGNTGNAADSMDVDNDGETNIEEYIAGTNPQSATDVFKIATIQKSGNTFTTTCAGKAGRTYTLLRNTDLGATWTRLGSKGPLASVATVTLTDTSAPADNLFYRIEVSLP